jgi:hypothetical protein
MQAHRNEMNGALREIVHFSYAVRRWNRIHAACVARGRPIDAIDPLALELDKQMEEKRMKLVQDARFQSL